MARARGPRPRPAPPPDPYANGPIVIETIGDPKWWLRDLSNSDEATCVNDVVKFQRFRVTIERLDEPVATLHDRLRRLWRQLTNHHHWDPVRDAARTVGLELDMKDAGRDRPRER